MIKIISMLMMLVSTVHAQLNCTLFRNKLNELKYELCKSINVKNTDKILLIDYDRKEINILNESPIFYVFTEDGRVKKYDKNKGPDWDLDEILGKYSKEMVNEERKIQLVFDRTLKESEKKTIKKLANEIFKLSSNKGLIGEKNIP